MAAAAASVAMRTAHKDDDTIIDFDVEFDQPRLLSSVLDKTDQVSHTKGDHEILKQHIVVVDQTVRFFRTLRDSSSNISADDKEYLDNLSLAFSDVSSAMQQYLALVSLSPTAVANVCPMVKSDGAGKPAFDISAELLEDFPSFTILFMLWNRQGFSMWRIRFSSLYCIPFSSPESIID